MVYCDAAGSQARKGIKEAERAATWIQQGQGMGSDAAMLLAVKKGLESCREAAGSDGRSDMLLQRFEGVDVEEAWKSSLHDCEFYLSAVNLALFQKRF